MNEAPNAPVPECRDTDDCCPGGPDTCRLDAARKAQQSQPRTGIACAALHTDRQGNTIPCPGYPHAKPTPRASVIEIIAKNFTPDADGPGSIIIPREVRINGVSVYTADRSNGIKVSDIVEFEVTSQGLYSLNLEAIQARFDHLLD